MSALRSSLQSVLAPGTSHGRCGCSSGVINPLSGSKSGAEMTAASPATARAAAIFGSCASDHFLNPLVRLFIEIPMIGVLFRIQEHNMWGRFQFVANKISRLRESFLRHLYSDGLTSKECDAIFHLIRKIRRLMAEFFSSRVRSDSSQSAFWSGQSSRTYDQGPQVRGDDAPARQHRVDPSHVVNTDRIRRDVNPGPNAMFQSAVVSSGAHSSSGREAVGDGEARPGAVSPAPAV